MNFIKRWGITLNALFYGKGYTLTVLHLILFSNKITEKSSANFDAEDYIFMMRGVCISLFEALSQSRRRTFCDNPYSDTIYRLYPRLKILRV